MLNFRMVWREMGEREREEDQSVGLVMTTTINRGKREEGKTKKKYTQDFLRMEREEMIEGGPGRVAYQRCALDFLIKE